MGPNVHILHCQSSGFTNNYLTVANTVQYRQAAAAAAAHAAANLRTFQNRRNNNNNNNTGCCTNYLTRQIIQGGANYLLTAGTTYFF